MAPFQNLKQANKQTEGQCRYCIEPKAIPASMYGMFPETYSEFLPYDSFDAPFYPKGQKLDFAVDRPDNEEP